MPGVSPLYYLPLLVIHTHTSSQYTSASHAHVSARAKVAVGRPKNIQVRKLISLLPVKRLHVEERQHNDIHMLYNHRIYFCTEQLLTCLLSRSVPSWVLFLSEWQLLRCWLQKQSQSPAPCSNAPQCHSKAVPRPSSLQPDLHRCWC